MGKLFGTDGIRGVANQHPITCEMALRTGKAVGAFIREKNFNAAVIGKDTRISGDMLESALAAGIASTGTQVFLAGVIPTPGVAFLCSDMKDIGAGIVISASHNPYQDNGIKIFKSGGEKLSDEEEADIEDLILNKNEAIHIHGSPGRIQVLENSLEKYASFLMKKQAARSIKHRTAKKIKLIADCSNGAASEIAKLVFNDSLFDATFIHDSPDGKNINNQCGSQHTMDLARMVVKNKADIGIAFDGDADRLIVIDEKGQQITGDCIIAICAKFAKEKKRLKNLMIVSTIMSNVGLTQALSSMGMKHIKADVGDRKVLEEMKACGSVIGGEDSGHMIFLDEHSTGDGMLSALMLLEVMSETLKPLSDLASIMTVFPQVLMNVEVDAKRPDFKANQIIADTISAIEEKLGEQGRVLIRYSGTQPLLRVMVEGPDQKFVENYCQQICQTIKENL